MNSERASVKTSKVESDIILVGGGLANSLIALYLRAVRPHSHIVMLERATTVDNSHTWCVFRSDLSKESWALLSPIFANVWRGYDVAFPAHTKRLTTPYARLTSQDLATAVETALGSDLIRGAEVAEVSANRVVLEDGRIFAASLVIDGRGYRPSAHLNLAYQKFVGLEVVLANPHGLEVPVVMDATVGQHDGYRFLYVLPLALDRLLIEDTRYSANSTLDISALELGCHRYANAQGWSVSVIDRVESGVLPVVLGGDIEAFWAEQVAIPAVGLRGAFFHPTTGYSLPEAALVAEAIARLKAATSAEVAAMLRARSMSRWKAGGFYRLLNRMMFAGAKPVRRYRVLERFYRLPQPLIERFYARRLTWCDTLRIVSGRPPVPLLSALRAIFSTGVSQHA